MQLDFSIKSKLKWLCKMAPSKIRVLMPNIVPLWNNRFYHPMFNFIRVRNEVIFTYNSATFTIYKPVLAHSILAIAIFATHFYWFSTCEKSYWLGIFSRGKDWWIIPLINSIWLAEGVETVSLEACCCLSSSFKLEAIILSTRRMGVKALNLATQATQMN